MLRRPLLLLLSAALVLAPAVGAFAEEGDAADVGTEATASDTTALSALADLVDAVAAALGIQDVAGIGEPVALDEAQREVLRALLEQVLEGIKVETLLASADASSQAEGPQDEGADEPVDAMEVDAEGTHGEIVSTVARCAPRGHGLRGLFESVKNHGAFVRVAAQGGSVTLTVPVLVGTGTDVTLGTGTDEVTHELTSVAAAEALCADLDVIATAASLAASLADDPDADADEGDDRATRDAAKADRRDGREAAKAERAERRDAAKAERREARDAARAESKNAQAGPRGKRSGD